MHTLIIEYRCKSCDDIHTITVNAPGVRAHAMVMFEVEEMVLIGITDFQVFAIEDDKRVSITSEIVSAIVNMHLDTLFGN